MCLVCFRLEWIIYLIMNLVDIRWDSTDLRSRIVWVKKKIEEGFIRFNMIKNFGEPMTWSTWYKT